MTGEPKSCRFFQLTQESGEISDSLTLGVEIIDDIDKNEELIVHDSNKVR